MKTKQKIYSVIMMVFMFTVPVILFAQPGPGGDPDAPVPIDGGLSLLIAAGVGYGAKKIHDNRKKNRK